MKIKPLDLNKNKKAQVQSIILAVITIFIIGIILFFFNHMNKKVYDEFDEYFEGNADLNDTEAHAALQDIQDLEGTSTWDYAFLAIFIGLNIQMIIFAFASRQNLAFFWLFVIIGIIVLILGTILSNIWQDISTQTEFASTILRFPITNTLLGTYFPTIITGVFYLSLIFLFGKFPGVET